MKLYHIFAAVLSCALLSNTASAQLPTYSQNFETMTPAGPGLLIGDNWQVGANVFDSTGTTFLYNYFAFPAPNNGAAFSAIVTGQGGAPQGNNQFSVFSDYNNTGSHTAGERIESNVFRDIGIISAADVGLTYTFSFDMKQGNIGGASTATAFMKALNQPSFSLDTLSSTATHTVGTNWTTGSLSMMITPAMVGDLMQIGFTNTASNFQPSGMFYDNLSFSAVPEPTSLALLSVGLVGLVSRRRRK